MNDKINTLKDLFYSAVSAVDPFNAVRERIEFINKFLQNSKAPKMLVVGFGKAGYKMAQAIEADFKENIANGIVIVPHSIHTDELKKIQILKGGHPLPDLNSIGATKKLIKLVTNSDPSMPVICLISGGGSALFASPVRGITLRDKKDTTLLLMKAGATIQELNIVRKHLSEVKGGRFARILYPRRTLALIISDVVGDSLQTIASGPTVPDESTFGDALGIIEKYRLKKSLPVRVWRLFEDGSKGRIEETPKKNDRIFRKVRNFIIANNKIALHSAKAVAEKKGYYTKILPKPITGEARMAGRILAERALRFKSELKRMGLKRGCLISGGETTVTVRGKGMGGRNQELALAFLQCLREERGIHLLSAGTDGIDGNTDSAGAFADAQTFLKARTMNLDPMKFLEDNDSYTFFRKTNALFLTGPTGTNVMDLQIILVEL